MGIGFTVTQAEGWKDLASVGMGWNTSDTAQGTAFRWNNLAALYESNSVYGEDYDFRYDGQVFCTMRHAENSTPPTTP